MVLYNSILHTFATEMFLNRIVFWLSHLNWVTPFLVCLLSSFFLSFPFLRLLKPLSCMSYWHGKMNLPFNAFYRIRKTFEFESRNLNFNCFIRLLIERSFWFDLPNKCWAGQIFHKSNYYWNAYEYYVSKIFKPMNLTFTKFCSNWKYFEMEDLRKYLEKRASYSDFIDT